jgi:hypothetical protein
MFVQLLLVGLVLGVGAPRCQKPLLVVMHGAVHALVLADLARVGVLVLLCDLRVAHLWPRQELAVPL